MSAPSILITGCSSGIGYACAHGLRARGWRVFASCKQELDCARLRDEGFEAPRIDYTDTDSILTGLSEVLEATDGRLDALFNNGAHATPGAVEDLPTDALRAIFESNFFGWHELTRHVIPVMRAQGHGRIVQCSSVLGLVALPWRGAYNATKYAVEGLTDTLRLEMRGTPIDVCLIEPGPVTSKIRANSIGHFEHWVDWENSPRAEDYRATLLKRLYEPAGGPDKFELPPEAVLKKLIHAVESRRPRPRYYVTTPTYIAGLLRRLLSTRALDKVMAEPRLCTHPARAAQEKFAMSDPFLILLIVAVAAVAIVLIMGLGSFAEGGKFNKRNSNKLMRLRILAQFIAVVLIVVYVWFIKGTS